MQKGLLPGGICTAMSVAGCFVFSVRFPTVAAVTGADAGRGKAEVKKVAPSRV